MSSPLKQGNRTLDCCVSFQGDYRKLSLREPLYIGGHPDLSHLYSKMEVTKGFRGCVERLLIMGKNIDLRPAPQGDAGTGVNVGKMRQRSESV